MTWSIGSSDGAKNVSSVSVVSSACESAGCGGSSLPPSVIRRRELSKGAISSAKASSSIIAHRQSSRKEAQAQSIPNVGGSSPSSRSSMQKSRRLGERRGASGSSDSSRRRDGVEKEQSMKAPGGRKRGTRERIRACFMYASRTSLNTTKQRDTLSHVDWLSSVDKAKRTTRGQQ